MPNSRATGILTGIFVQFAIFGAARLFNPLITKPDFRNSRTRFTGIGVGLDGKFYPGE